MPAKVVLQLTTAFKEGGLCNRNGTFSYKDHLRECQTPVLALAGDKDLIQNEPLVMAEHRLGKILSLRSAITSDSFWSYIKKLLYAKPLEKIYH